MHQELFNFNCLYPKISLFRSGNHGIDKIRDQSLHMMGYEAEEPSEKLQIFLLSHSISHTVKSYMLPSKSHGNT